MQLDAIVRRDLPGVGGVVGHGLQPLVLAAESDGVGVDPRVIPVGQHGDDAGVQAAAQEARHRHVGHQMGGDRFLDDRAQVGGRPGGRLSRDVSGPPVVLDQQFPSGRKRAHEPPGSFSTPSMAHRCSGSQ